MDQRILDLMVESNHVQRSFTQRRKGRKGKPEPISRFGVEQDFRYSSYHPSTLRFLTKSSPLRALRLCLRFVFGMPKDSWVDQRILDLMIESNYAQRILTQRRKGRKRKPEPISRFGVEQDFRYSWQYRTTQRFLQTLPLCELCAFA